MLENPEAFEDSSDSGDSAAAAPTTPPAAASATAPASAPAIQAIKQEDKSTYESAVEEEEEEEEDDYWDEEKERGADSDGDLWGEAAAKRGVTGKTQWERHNDDAASSSRSLSPRPAISPRRPHNTRLLYINMLHTAHIYIYCTYSGLEWKCVQFNIGNVEREKQKH